MVRKLSAMILFAVMTLSLVGCRYAPESSIVVGKSYDALLQKAREPSGKGTLRERLEAPAYFETGISDLRGKLNVHIDAKVIVPNAEQVPICRVHAGIITREQTNTLLELLAKADLYSEESKEALERQLAAAEQRLNNPTANDMNTVYYLDGEQVSWEVWLEHEICDLSARYEAASAEAELKPVTGRFRPREDGSDRLVYGTNWTETYGHEEFSVWDMQSSFMRAAYTRRINHYPWIVRFDDTDLSNFPGILLTEITEYEATAICNTLLERLGLDDMTVSYVSKQYHAPIADRIGWVLHYTRCVNGIPITYTDIQSAGGGQLDGVVSGFYRAPWPYEVLTCIVDESGIIAFDWMSPYEMGETVIEDAALLSFKEVMDIFRKMFVVTNNDMVLEVTIREIRLGYARVREQGQTDGLLIPVWDFFGTMTYENGEVYSNPERSLLTINAVDGTVIDRISGY